MTRTTAHALESERADIVSALSGARGNVSLAARALALSVRTLYRRLREHGIDPGQYRATAGVDGEQQ